MTSDSTDEPKGVSKDIVGRSEQNDTKYSLATKRHRLICQADFYANVAFSPIYAKEQKELAERIAEMASIPKDDPSRLAEAQASFLHRFIEMANTPRDEIPMPKIVKKAKPVRTNYVGKSNSDSDRGLS